MGRPATYTMKYDRKTLFHDYEQEVGAKHAEAFEIESGDKLFWRITLPNLS